MPLSPSLRRFRQRLREFAEYLPPLPRLPSRREIADWWHNLYLPSIPSPRRLVEWFRERRHEDILPALPKLPSAESIAEHFRERPPKELRGSFLPSIRALPEWFREEPGRRRILWWSLAVAVVIAAAIPLVPRAVRGVKGWHARRLTVQAATLIETRQWRDAARKLQDAFRLRNSEPEVWRAYARLLSRTGQGNIALEWWQKLAQTRPLTPDDRRDFATAALNVSELALAAEQVAYLLDASGEPAPSDLLLAAQLATLRGYSGTAQEFAQRVLDDIRSTSREKLGADLVILSNNTPDAQNYRDATQRLVDLARNESDPAAPDALLILGRQQRSERLTTISNDPLAIGSPDVTTALTMPLLEIAQRLESNPSSRPFHRMLAFELYARVDPNRTDELVNRALESYRGGDDETLYALGAWLYTRSRYAAILKILPLERAEQRRELLLEHIDALAALNRLEEVKEILCSEHAVLDPAFQHMYLAAVQTQLGETTPAANEWIRALEEARSPRALIGLAEFAEKKNELRVADAAYARLIQKQPELKSAYNARLRVAQARGATIQAHDTAKEILRLWPEDQPTRVRECYLRILLLQPAPDELAAAESEAAGFLSTNPWDGVARSAVALAQLKQGKSAAALTTFSEFNSQVPSSAISLPVYVAALAANGWKDKAREQAQALAAENILPEERALIAPILAQ